LVYQQGDIIFIINKKGFLTGTFFICDNPVIHYLCANAQTNNRHMPTCRAD